MDHAEALELIELAAVEPDGLDRMMAGDTPESSAVAGHLAGCPACATELVRIRRTAMLARKVLASQPDPALRERTLAVVREVGRDRTAPGPNSTGGPAGSSGSPRPVAAPPLSTVRAATARRSWAAIAGIAAGLILAVALGFAVATVRSPADELRAEVAVLQETTEATLRLQAAPDTERVALVPTDAGTASAGELLFSRSSGELLVVASGLAPLVPGDEYLCWVEADGERRRLGEMYAGGDLQSWAGTVDGLADLPPDAVFGVSLVPDGAESGTPVLTGSL
ncbi:MAG: hypothetical protein QG587_924 [Chloroflexota bacterium]|nr:hypothetical protein [Chloroflexota bacterium]